MLIDAGRSLLLVVDVQERLLPAMAEPAAVLDRSALLLKAASRLGVPVVMSEQYPQGLGSTVPALAALAPADSVQAKLHFSCAADPALAERIRAGGRRQVVIAGIEAHVCVLQSAFGFRAAGLDCFVVEDATASRRQSDKAAALARLRAGGISVVTAEMVIFEWLGAAGTPAFKELSRLVR